jgi:hypothetical protein
MKNFEVCAKMRQWAYLQPYPRICLGGLENTKNILSQDSRSSGRDLNPELPDYEAGLGH